VFKQALNPAFLKQKVEQKEIELFKKEFITLLDNIDKKESEEFHKNLIKNFLNFYITLMNLRYQKQ
jgi:hypothetical protein